MTSQRSVVVWQSWHGFIALALSLIALLLPTAVAPALVVYGLASFVVLAVAARAPLWGGGGANTLTFGRLLAVLAALSMLVLGVGTATLGGWLIVGLLLAAEATDYLDGLLARRNGSTPFGETFDMEVDAYVTLALALIAVGFRDAPAWLLAAGIWRYAYAVWEAALTYRSRRNGNVLPCDVTMPAWFRWQAKTICAVSVMALILLTAPGLPRSLVVTLSAAVVAILSYSFVAGTLILLRLREEAPSRFA